MGHIEQPSAEVGEVSLGQSVAVLDGGGQYVFDIEQVIKRLGFNAVRLPFDTPVEELDPYGAWFLSGGPKSVYAKNAPQPDARLFDQPQKPIYGSCYGMQLINLVMGGEVGPLERREDGPAIVTVDPGVDIFEGLDREQEVLMSHGDSVTKVAPRFEVIAMSGDIVAGIRAKDRPVVGLQFHPEVYTEDGPKMFRNFLENVAGLEGGYEYTIEQFAKDAIAEIKEQVGDKEVLAFISGGVDSSTLAKLLQIALPSEQTNFVYVDSGLMRQGETREIKKLLNDSGVEVQIYDGTDFFAGATTTIDGQETEPLFKVTDPEIKRKIIGDAFIKLQEKIAGELGLDPDSFLLAMGTLHTDLIESGSKVASANAAVIKSHHNDSPLARQLREQGRVIEPLRHLQKDDVRLLAKHLGLVNDIVRRQPFPGPGLAIRIICADKPYITDESPAIARQLQKFNSPEVSTSLLPVRTVGVQGDDRTYSHLAGLSGEPNWQELRDLAIEIPKTIHGVNRVAYIIGDQIEGLIDEVTPTHVDGPSVDQLRSADAAVNRILRRHGLHQTISQVPVVLLPVNFGQPGKRSIGIRTFMTTNYKTGDIAVPGVDFDEAVLNEMVEEILRLPGIARVMYDLTPKPPATTEWE